MLDGSLALDIQEYYIERGEVLLVHNTGTPHPRNGAAGGRLVA